MRRKQVNGARLRRAINQSIRDGRVFYEQLDDGRWYAEVAYLQKHSFSNEEHFGWQTTADGFEIKFTPNEIEYNGTHVYNLGDPYPVDWKTYCWAVRKLSEHQIMDKLES